MPRRSVRKRWTKRKKGGHKCLDLAKGATENVPPNVDIKENFEGMISESNPVRTPTEFVQHPVALDHCYYGSSERTAQVSTKVSAVFPLKKGFRLQDIVILNKPENACTDTAPESPGDCIFEEVQESPDNQLPICSDKILGSSGDQLQACSDEVPGAPCESLHACADVAPGEPIDELRACSDPAPRVQDIKHHSVGVLEETVVASPGYRVTLLSASTLALETAEHSPKKIPDNLISRMKDKLQVVLPKYWLVSMRENGVHIGLMADSTFALVIQRSLLIDLYGNIIPAVHGSLLPEDHALWNRITKIHLTEETLGSFINFITIILTKLRGMEMCTGVQEFEEEWSRAPNSYIDFNPFKERRFKKTCRSFDCSILVSSLRIRRCQACVKVWDVVRGRINRKNKGSTCMPPLKKNHSLLSPTEVILRLKQDAREKRILRGQNKRLKQKIDSLLKKLDLQENVETLAT